MGSKIESRVGPKAQVEVTVKVTVKVRVDTRAEVMLRCHVPDPITLTAAFRKGAES